MQQFWNTMKYDEKTGVYSFQVDEQWFDLSADLLRKELAITPVIPAQPFELPSSVLDRKDIWQDPDIFLTQGKSQSQSKGPKEESNSSPHSLWMVFQGNLKFVLKGKTVEVFGMVIPDPLITEAIQQSSYYPKYLEMVAKNTKKTPQESASVKPATKRAPPKKPLTTTPVKQSKPAPTPIKKPSKHKLPQKVRKGKPTFQLVDDDDEGPSAGSNQGKSTKKRRYDLGASEPAQPPTKDDEQSSRKPRESDASASKQHLLPNNIQLSPQLDDDIPMKDEENDSDMEDTDKNGLL
ncbi:hypothetical protein Tco_0806591 [Tanacetum coccineum]